MAAASSDPLVFEFETLIIYRVSLDSGILAPSLVLIRSHFSALFVRDIYTVV